MHVLFDQNVPRKLRPFLKGHEIRTADEQGWATISNGELLKAAEGAGFDVVLTCDQNVIYQQNIEGRQLALIVLSTNDWNVLKHCAATVAASIDRARTGRHEVVELRARTPGPMKR